MPDASVFSGIHEGMSEVCGVRLDLPPPTPGDDGFAIIRAIVPAGSRIPLHSRPDRAVVVVVEGRLGVWLEGAWSEVGTGEQVDLRPGLDHALTNAGDSDLCVVLVTTQRVRQFLADIVQRGSSGLPAGGSVASHLLERAEAFGFRIAADAEQAAIAGRQVLKPR